MRFDPELAEIRFGCGLSPRHAPPVGPEEMLAALRAPDVAATDWPIPGFDGALADARAYSAARRTRKAAIGSPLFDARDKDLKRQRALMRDHQAAWFTQRLLRCITTPNGFRERLTLFWADHFTAQGKIAALRYGATPYVESAIRPNIAARFEDLLIAAVTSPLMLHYLDQHRSTGPNSRRAKRVARRRGRQVGLNENLAREVLELHTLGVGGPYGQQDVRQLAELFTGMIYDINNGFKFAPGWAEPGGETVLGQPYDVDVTGLEAIKQALRDLARHPATADHLARKLVVHFTRDTPDPVLVAHLADRYRATSGDLMQVYAALLEHPAAWESDLGNVKPPFAYLASACRALAMPPEALTKLSRPQVNRFFLRPMQRMGQRWEFSGGPDGWSEADGDWITPQALAERLRWCMSVPTQLMGAVPPPRTALQDALGSRSSARLRFVATAAETEREAVGLILAAPAFQRR
ncbi:DUF1800 domain-containing protein [Phaeobacter gallaeciensis]|uniref:DUF1800 domain-containing protein n=1 Tax=Phaeobacter gallaeciensis TaxID=60890 RepID=A0AAD0EAK5_9RHOB|nr:DUF1800 domain-containing protein [Phaeobacter gallaeciensis]AHD08714.1 Uncharacterized protein in bacteria [Phaeobacter gallaeciensis DSM 26640]ATE91980.1 putative protein in bacteria [Phaeobacter gallaeciensis]ATE98196.1 putative protein in bacteria [Phaeobacter gallaeciensis]ATF00596.1 putative protein in bacteria [Phaeobacter gallaeciensis]ATF05027.1 putative protein in bacteria [Phaeobacter gallaeciensis]